MPMIGFLSSRSIESDAQLVAGFHQGLAESGFVEGRNVTVEYRWAHGEYSRLPKLAAELVSKPVAVAEPRPAQGVFKRCVSPRPAYLDFRA
jgi:putative tryptophan/tyrosine transport system substrate-binding protein